MAQFIGVSGIAGAGKDLFCSLAQDYFHTLGTVKRKVFIKSLAFALKEDVRGTCLELYGVDPTKANRKDKNKIRDSLVFYGDVMRKKTNGRYWVDKMDAECYLMEKAGAIGDNDIVMISDIRYNEFPKDEVPWVKNEKNGVLVHIKKHFTVDSGFFSKKVHGEPPTPV